MSPGTDCLRAPLAPQPPRTQGTSPIYNLLPDILSNLSKEASLSKPQFQAIMQHVRQRGVAREGAFDHGGAAVVCYNFIPPASQHWKCRPASQLPPATAPAGAILEAPSSHTSPHLPPIKPPAAAGLHQEGQAGRLAD